VAERTDSLRVAIAHEWLIKYAGSERCVVEMRREFPDSRLLTTIAGPDETLPPELRGAEPSLLGRLPGAARAYQWLIPAMPAAWSARPAVADVDLVISSSHACAKGVRVAPGIPHLCYCHTPMRYAWDFASESARFPRAVRPLARASAKGLRRWDRRSARRVTRFVANSTAVAERIRRVYGREADVIHPPVDTEYFTPGGEPRDFFLFVGRLVAYKRPDLVLEAFADLRHPLVVVGDGHMAGRLAAVAGPRVRFERFVTQERLRDLYRSARALVYPGEEDFGIVMAEAQACGTPVIALGRGGAVDIVSHAETGWLLAEPEPRSLAAAVTWAAGRRFDRREIRRRAERFSPEAFRAGIRRLATEIVGTRQEESASPESRR
jgi:glycosyltransferase involved in cell wall biosynthesis